LIERALKQTPEEHHTIMKKATLRATRLIIFAFICCALGATTPRATNCNASSNTIQARTIERLVHINSPGADDSRYAYVAFDVPAHAIRVSVSYDYERGAGPDANTIDIGLFDARSTGSDTDPPGFRGWSGGRRSSFFIARDEATPGYLPGRMPAGTWRIILGLYKVAPAGVDVSLKIKVETEANTSLSIPPSAAPGKTEPSPANISTTISGAKNGARPSSSLPQKVGGHGMRWWRGDLHMHTVHSDGDWTIEGLIASARDAGLDFICITDHNTASHHAEIDRLRAASPPTLLLLGEEITTYGGHTNAWGLPSGTWIDFRAHPGDDARMSDIAAQAHRSGALISINHPFALCGGCSWSYDASARGFDAIEVWNGPWDSTDESALKMWDKILQSGRRITAIASSDSHRPEAPIGQPTTHVAASVLSRAALLEAIRQGRVYLTGKAAGPVINFEAGATNGKRRPRWTTGDEIRLNAPGTIRFFINTKAAPPGATLSLISDGQVKTNINAKPSGEPQVIEIECLRDSYYRLEVRDSKGIMLALTNPIYATIRTGR
jgi:hypothetical protein